MKKYSTKKALIASVLTLALCFTSLIGTTFAWFTDSVTSSGNIIKTGNLNVEMYYADGTKAVPADDSTDWKNANGVAIYQANQLWEPGYTDAKHIKVSNEGSLALKYQLAIIPTGVVSKLADVIDVYLYETAGTDANATQVANRDAIDESMYVGSLADVISKGIVRGSLAAGADYTTTIVLKMQENAGNEYMNLSIGDSFTIQLFATQYTSEEDSFDKYYDAGAAWTGIVDTEWYDANPTATAFTIYTSEQLAGLAKIVNSGVDTFIGDTITLASDVNLAGLEWTPIGSAASMETKFNGTFIGTGYTIYNLYVDQSKYAGLFGCTWNSAHIEGVTVKGALVTGNDYVGAILGGGYLSQNCIKNCTVENATISAIPYLTEDGVYDGGAKAGAIVGSAYNGNIVGNKAINCEIEAYRDLGGVCGMLYADGDMTLKAEGNEVDGVTLTYFELAPGAEYDGGKVNENMGNVAGRLSANKTEYIPTVSGSIETDVKTGSVTTWTEDGVVYTENTETGVVTLKKIAADFEGEKLVVIEGVTHLGNKILQGNTQIKEVVIPASVVDFGGKKQSDMAAGGGMFYKSAVEKITLPEGITEIPVGAFNQASNLKEINIPSTVTTIGIGAFGGSGLTELNIPASVTTIGGGAFRDMANLTTVTIEGDVYVPDYAFRACSSLKNVYLMGNNVSFGTNMVFTVTSSNNENPNGITVHVANAGVKARLDATGDFKGTVVVPENSIQPDTNGVYTGENGEKYAYATNSNDISNAISGGASTLYLDNGIYVIPNSAQGKTLTIVGSVDTKIATNNDTGSYEGCNYAFDGSTVTFENITINTPSTLYIGYARCKATYNNCTINGTYTLYDNSTFNNCTFNVSGDIYNIWTWGAPNATFNDCTFNTSGKAILLYGNTNTVLTVTNCVFNDANDYDDVNNKAAIEVGSDWTADTKTIIASNCTVNGFDVTSKGLSTGSTLFGDKNDLFTKNRLTVTVDGNKYVSNGLYKDAQGNYYVYNAAGLAALNDVFTNGAYGHAIWGASFNIMADIDATGMTWNTVSLNTPNNDCNGFTWNGNGHTIKGLTINGSGLFWSTANGKNSDVPVTFKDLTFDGATVDSASHHVGIFWGQMYGDIVFENVHVKNSSVTGTCNVGAFIGRNGDEGKSTATYKNCSVTNTVIVANGNGDPNGASVFQGSALTIGTSATAKVTFENCTQSGNTLTTADGQVGGGIYAWWNASTNEYGAVAGFENYN